MNLTATSTTPAAATAPQLRFELKFNPALPLPGSGPSEVTALVEDDRVPYASFTNTQNPNYLRAGTHWTHDRYTPAFAPKADRYAAILREAAEALRDVPSDTPSQDYTRNGAFELTFGGSTWRGSLLHNGRGPVKDAVSALRELARDLKRGVDGQPNSV